MRGDARRKTVRERVAAELEAAQQEFVASLRPSVNLEERRRLRKRVVSLRKRLGALRPKGS